VLLVSVSAFADRQSDPADPAAFCAEDINRSATTLAVDAPATEASPPRVSFLGDAAVVIEYPSVYDVHTSLDPSRDIRSQPGHFLVRTILQDLAPHVDESTYDFVLMYSLQELPGWIHSGGRWNGAPAKNIGLVNSEYGNGPSVAGWSRLRGTPHMNAVDLSVRELFEGADSTTLLPIHEMGHYWMVYWSQASLGPREWRPDDPIAHLAGGYSHWSWNWLDTIPGPEDMPGMMYSAPLSQRFNEFDLYAMGLMGFAEASGISHEIYECAPPDYDACNPGVTHDLTVGHLLESLELAGPEYFEGDGRRLPAADREIGELNALLVVIKGEDEPVSDDQAALITDIAQNLPGAWSTATWGRSHMSTAVRADITINPGLNDAWFDPARPGQGFMFTVYPELQLFFLSWFAFDTGRPGAEVTAVFGEPGHRWLTALGSWVGNTAALTVELTTGGVFDSPEPPVDPQVAYGAITIVFRDCNHATLDYDLPMPGLAGTMELTRVATDNVALCESLGTP